MSSSELGVLGVLTVFLGFCILIYSTVILLQKVSKSFWVFTLISIVVLIQLLYRVGYLGSIDFSLKFWGAIGFLKDPIYLYTEESKNEMFSFLLLSVFFYLVMVVLIRIFNIHSRYLVYLSFGVGLMLFHVIDFFYYKIPHKELLLVFYCIFILWNYLVNVQYGCLLRWAFFCLDVIELRIIISKQ